MSKAPSKSKRYGDLCFREAHAGRSPEEIRRELASAARASIRRSIAVCIGPKAARCDWPWLRAT